MWSMVVCIVTCEGRAEFGISPGGFIPKGNQTLCNPENQVWDKGQSREKKWYLFIQIRLRNQIREKYHFSGSSNCGAALSREEQQSLVCSVHGPF